MGITTSNIEVYREEVENTCAYLRSIPIFEITLLVIW
jgi:hypothetical protein